jgi:hypothetical protein
MLICAVLASVIEERLGLFGGSHQDRFMCCFELQGVKKAKDRADRNIK